MSFYSSVEGTITFKNKAHFDLLANKLIEGGWYSMKDKQFTGECSELIGGFINFDKMTIKFPYCTQRNIERAFSAVDIIKLDFEGELRCESDDGTNEAWIYRSGEELHCDIDEYAKVNGLTYYSELADDDDDRYEVRQDVVEEFWKNPTPIPNSKKFIEED